MLRFSEFESLGLSIAAVTEAADGDFARPGGRPEEEALALAALPSRPVVTMRQIHGTHIETADERNLRDLRGADGDGLITHQKGIAIAVRVADCVPVFLFDPATRAAGIVHAGRRGTLDGVTSAAIRSMQERFGTVPSALHALIGPSAGPCCYEVSGEMASEFSAAGYPIRGRHLDLWEANTIQLERAGLHRSRVTISGQCTICGDRFHSYRRTGTTARNLAIAAL